MQQQSQFISRKQKAFDLLTLTLTIKYEPVIYKNQTELNAKIIMTPKRPLINTPLEIQLRGYSHMQIFNHSNQKIAENSIEITEEYLNETNEKMQVNVLMGESNKFEGKHKLNPKITQLDDLNEQKIREGEYFLEGCHVLYQISEETGERLQTLLEGKVYTYPISFTLPPKLPSSIENIILKDIHITIQYSLEIKIVSIDKDFGKKQLRTLIIPFEIHQSPKQYPYEELVVNELIRLYHTAGKRRDELMNKPLARLINCLCPQFIYDEYLSKRNHVQTKFKNYDLFHLELVTVVNKDYHVFLIVRTYQEPEAEALTLNREKNDKKALLKEVNSIGEVSNDISLGSIKHTERKNLGFGIYKVEVEMIAELVGICTQSIFKKMVTLNQSTYDMLQGEIMVNLNQYMTFPKSCNNELFVLKYHFNLRPFFGEDEGEGPQVIQMQDFVVESNKNQLYL